MPDSFISDDMRSILGKTLDTAVSYPVSASDIRRWALAVYYPETPPAVHWDEDHAASTPYGGIIAPDEFNPFVWGARHREPRFPRTRTRARASGSPRNGPESEHPTPVTCSTAGWSTPTPACPSDRAT